MCRNGKKPSQIQNQPSQLDIQNQPSPLLIQNQTLKREFHYIWIHHLLTYLVIMRKLFWIKRETI